MVVSTYQVNNVLRVYGDQLRQNRVTSKLKTGDTRSPDRINISAEAKRRAIIDKIASDIVNKISQHGPNEDVEKEAFKELENELGMQLSVDNKGADDLIFKVIDENGETTNALSIEDSKFVRHKLEEIAKGIIDKTMI